MNAAPPLLPVSDDELNAFVDGHLPVSRRREVEAFLASHADAAARVHAYRAQKRALHALFDPVLSEPVPRRLKHAAQSRTPWYRRPVAAGLAIALVSAATGWSLGIRSRPTGGDQPARVSASSPQGFAHRAAIAHSVYSPDARRPVEVDAAHEDQLLAWLSKRMGAPLKAPHLQAQGYELEGGRLLPGGEGPVAQFMYRNALGSRMTLYVTNDTRDLGQADSAFRFVRQGAVNVFYWVDGAFGYALSADTDRAVLARVSAEVYRQLGADHYH